MNQQLIIIRGNSGSGKSVVAKRVREGLVGKVAVIGQDELRRGILMEEDSLESTDILGLLRQTSEYCFDNGYTVIIEGILGTQKYKDVLEEILAYAWQETHIFYLDVSLEETLRRHATKLIASDFGEDKLREWYKPKHLLKIEGEIVIPEHSSLEESVAFIQSQL